MIFVVIFCWARPKTKITQNKFKGLWVYMACTKTRNTETKPSKRNHRNHWTTETPERNQRNTGTKPPEPPKKLIQKLAKKRSRQPQWHHRYWIPGGLSWIIISSIVSSDFPASVVLLSQSLQFAKHKKSEIKRKSTQSTSRTVKRFPMSTQRPQTTAHPVTEGWQIPENLRRLAWKRRRKQCKHQVNKN